MFLMKFLKKNINIMYGFIGKIGNHRTHKYYFRAA